ncbi:hypothetical protein IV203_000052 [Nitzschia inconspicua]|uniref:Uncharacterized protein n=1 Tax=Nitzschia inconspicua TaxID=303405 RepID=A0A9K3L5U4_9STRA|nr:hypothetical protein IV203_000035 [Nitzschia inconspicua]KAG7355366.1 hypothetical protein IV203_000052 [Nitzschia inconspicua]
MHFCGTASKIALERSSANNEGDNNRSDGWFWTKRPTSDYAAGSILAIFAALANVFHFRNVRFIGLSRFFCALTLANPSTTPASPSHDSLAFIRISTETGTTNFFLTDEAIKANRKCSASEEWCLVMSDWQIETQ